MLKVRWNLRVQAICFTIVVVCMSFFARSLYEHYRWVKLEHFWRANGAVLTRVENGSPMLVINDDLASPMDFSGKEKFQMLSDIDDLGYLFISIASLSDSDVQDICDLELPALVSLSLNDTNISDKALSHVSSLKQLKRLHLNNTDITDDSIEVLGKLGSLVEINIEGTRVTPNGLSKLRCMRPDAIIHFSPGQE